MKIAFISTMWGASWGGSEELWSRAACKLRERGVSIGISYGDCEPPAQMTELRERGCGVTYRTPGHDFLRHILMPLVPEDLRYFVRGFCEIRQKPRHYQWLDTFHPDLAVLSLGDQMQGYDWMRACAKRDIPYAVIVQKFMSTRWPRNSGILLQHAKGYGNAGRCFFVSHQNLKETKAQFGIELPNARVIANPFKVKYGDPVPWPEVSSPLRLACVGRLSPEDKGQEILFDILEKSRWRERPLEVTFFGNGKHLTYFKQRKEKRKLEHVRFGGFVEDPASIWESHHMLALPSREEGMSLALEEALLCGRPALVTDVGGNRELVKEGRNGYIAEAPHVRYVEMALEKAWQARSQWKDLGEHAFCDACRVIPKDPAEELTQALEAWIAQIKKVGVV